MTGIILIDLETIHHDVLLQKLYATGIQTHTVNWFKSNLFNRSFLVNLENNFSQTKFVSWGVPKNFILQQLLFLMYVNDISQALKRDIFLFSNGSCLFRQHKILIKLKKS